MSMNKNILITGSSRGIGRYLVNYYIENGFTVFGCSRSKNTYENQNYHHFLLDVSNEEDVKNMFREIRKGFKVLDFLINNAGVASMNHSLLTNIDTLKKIFDTNMVGTFLLCREAAKLMQTNNFGRIINFSTVAVPLNLEGEAIYASSKASVEKFTQILAKELGSYGITVNAIGPTPIQTDLIKSIPDSKIKNLINNQAIKRLGEFEDVVNVIDFFLNPKSSFITGQVIYLGGV